MTANFLLEFALETTLKVTLLSAVAIVFVAATRRRTSAAVRNGVCVLALGAALLTPVAGVYVRMQRAAKPTSTIPLLYLPIPRAVSLAPVTPLMTVAPVAAAALPAAAPTVAATATAASSPQAMDGLGIAPSPVASPLAALLPATLTIAYMVGAAILLLRTAAGFLALRRLSAHCTPVETESAIGVAATAALGAAGVQTSVRILISEANSITTPLTWGAYHPTIALPAAAGDWPADRLRAALLHEAAHIRRTDFLLLAVWAPLTTALYWFHPLVWILVRLMRAEGERACDDIALAAGRIPGVDYARYLIDVARDARSPSPFLAVAMARTPAIEGRLRAILDAGQNRFGTTGPGTLLFWAALPLLMAFVALSPSGARSASAARVAGLPARPSAEDNPRQITLPNGATVRLLGVFDPTAGPKGVWWGADGKPLAVSPMINTIAYPKPTTGTKWRSIAYTVSCSVKEQPQETWAEGVSEEFYDRVFPEGNGKSRYAVEPVPSIAMVPDDHLDEVRQVNVQNESNTSKGERRLTRLWPEAFRSGVDQAEISVPVCAGAWTQIFTCPLKAGRTEVSTQAGGVHIVVDLHPQGAEQDVVHVGAYDHLISVGYTADRRLVALDRDGSVVADLGLLLPTPSGDPEAGDRTKWMTEGFLPKRLLPRVAGIGYYMRPTQTATFPHVALEAKK